MAWLPFIVLFSVSVKRRLSLSSLSRHSSLCYCPPCLLFKILTRIHQGRPATLVLNSQNCYLKSCYLLYSLVLHPVFIALGTAWIFLVTGNGRLSNGPWFPRYRYETICVTIFDGSHFNHRFRWAFTRLGRIPHRKMDLQTLGY